MATRPFPALLAIFTVFVSCTVIGRVSNNYHRKMIYQDLYICTNSGLTKFQSNMCRRDPNTTLVALKGLKEAVKECQIQFQRDRWNCSSLTTRSGNPYTSSIYQKGFRETAFAHALSSASVVVAVAKACSQGLLLNCGCDNSNKFKSKRMTASDWKWEGCHDNLPYGLKFSRRFLDSREKTKDLHSSVVHHNNRVGRMEVKANIMMKCKCHGVSGSCEQKICWRTVPNIRSIAEKLKEKYRRASFFALSNDANVPAKKTRKKPTHSKKEMNLRYYEKSPSFCEKDEVLGIPGTTGRRCNRNSTSDPDSCAVICCGRGHNLVCEKREVNCNCTFTWCCKVKCEKCLVANWISICK